MRLSLRSSKTQINAEAATSKLKTPNTMDMESASDLVSAPSQALVVAGIVVDVQATTTAIQTTTTTTTTPTNPHHEFLQWLLLPSNHRDTIKWHQPSTTTPTVANAAMTASLTKLRHATVAKASDAQIALRWYVIFVRCAKDRGSTLFWDHKFVKVVLRRNVWIVPNWLSASVVWGNAALLQLVRWRNSGNIQHCRSKSSMQCANRQSVLWSSKRCLPCSKYGPRNIWWRVWKRNWGKHTNIAYWHLTILLPVLTLPNHHKDWPAPAKPTTNSICILKNSMQYSFICTYRKTSQNQGSNQASSHSQPNEDDCHIMYIGRPEAYNKVLSCAKKV